MNETLKDMLWTQCIYSGIYNQIEFEMKYGSEDRTEELQYVVDKYCNENIVSGSYLQEKLDEYKRVVKEKQKNENNT